jgi:hypothetical protein
MFGNKTYLSCKNCAGSVQHYFHFLLGFLVPLVARLEQTPSGAKAAKFVIRSCGPMDRHLLALNYSNVEIIPAFKHKFGLASLAHKLAAGETLPGYDAIERYDRDVFRKAAGFIKARLGVKDAGKTGPAPRVVAINRSLDRFYNTGRSEIKGSGTQRRSIPNFAELAAHLAAVCPDYQSIILEAASLAEQAEQFQNADVIIAQHGAALGNLIFCRPGARIIEIAPPNPPAEYFARLADCLELDYRFYRQKSIHAEVNPAEVAALLG